MRTVWPASWYASRCPSTSPSCVSLIFWPLITSLLGVMWVVQNRTVGWASSAAHSSLRRSDEPSSASAHRSAGPSGARLKIARPYGSPPHPPSLCGSNREKLSTSCGQPEPRRLDCTALYWLQHSSLSAAKSASRLRIELLRTVISPSVVEPRCMAQPATFHVQTL